MEEHNKWWLEEATNGDIADLNYSTEDQANYIAQQIKPALTGEHPRILEIGCGYGRLTREIKRLYPKAIVTGTDIVPEFLSRAEQHSGWLDKEKGVKPENYPAYYMMFDLDALPQQHAIYTVALFQHLPVEGKREYISQVAKTLKVGGIFLVQFVEGDQDSFLMHDITSDEMLGWLSDAGFGRYSIANNKIVPRWTWITAVR